MDPLPLSINQYQLKLMQDCASQAIAQLQEHQAGFASGDNEKKEQNLLTYGTDDYEEAHTLVQTMDEQLKSHLEKWDRATDESKIVSLPLNSYQIKLLRTCIEHQSHNLSSSKNDAQQQLENLIAQLPESSPHEDSD